MILIQKWYWITCCSGAILLGYVIPTTSDALERFTNDTTGSIIYSV